MGPTSTSGTTYRPALGVPTTFTDKNGRAFGPPIFARAQGIELPEGEANPDRSDYLNWFAVQLAWTVDPAADRVECGRDEEWVTAQDP